MSMQLSNIGRAGALGGSSRTYWHDVEEYDTPPRWLRSQQLRDFFSVLDGSSGAAAFEKERELERDSEFFREVL